MIVTRALSMTLPDLFGNADVPPGFLYRPDLITVAEERKLLAVISALEFSAVEMRGVVAKRRTVHFGWTYGYYSRRSEPGEPLPEFLLPLRVRMAEWAGLRPEVFEEALLTEYPPAAPIGWHRDAPMFGDVVGGISLRSACRMKFRPYVNPADAARLRQPRRATHEVELAPRSGYLIGGVSRRDYEHSIPPVGRTRYSITFRSVRR